MFTSAQLLVFLSVAAVLLVAYVYARRGGAGRRLASIVLPGVFLLLAGFLGSNVFNMLSNGSASVRRFSSPQTYSSDNILFWFLVALQMGAALLMLAAAARSWRRRNEA